MRRRHRALSLPVAVVTLVAWAAAAGEARAAELAMLTLQLNGVDEGDVVVALTENDVWVPVDALEQAGLESIAGVVEPRDGAPHVSLASLAPDVRYRIDTRELALLVEVQPALLATTHVDLRGAPPTIERVSTPSAFVNYAARVTDFLHVSGYGELGASYRSAVLTTGVSASLETGVLRGLTSLTIDEPGPLRRWVAGDTFVHGGELGGALLMGGISLTKTFTLNPYFRSQPSAAHAGAVSTPSTLDVYVNGERRYSKELPPGPYQLESLPLPAGAGDVRYVVRDRFGREQAVASPFYSSGSLLAPGLHDYSYAFGARRLDVGTESFRYGGLGLLGRHRVGVTHFFTAGGRLEAAPDLVSAGPSLTLATPLGQIDAALASSLSAAHLGGAASLGYSYRGLTFGTGVMLRAMSPRYATLSLRPDDDRRLLDARAHLATPLTSWLSLGTAAQGTLWRDQGPAAHVDATVQWRLWSGVSLVASGGLGYGVTGPSANVALHLSFGVPWGDHAWLAAGVRDEAPEASAQISRSLPRGRGVGYRASVTAAERPSAHLEGQLQLDMGRYRATADVTPSGNHLSAEAAGGVIAVHGGGLFLTRPVSQSYALVQVPGVKGVRAFLNNHEVGVTDDGGNVVVTDLMPYYGNRLSISDTDLPLGHDIATEERVVGPPFRGGALVVFPARPARFYRGRVLLHEGAARRAPAYGEISFASERGSHSSPVTAEGLFELDGPPPGTYSATVRYSDGTCAFDIVIPASADPVADLGTLECTP